MIKERKKKRRKRRGAWIVGNDIVSDCITFPSSLSCINERTARDAQGWVARREKRGYDSVRPADPASLLSKVLLCRSQNVYIPCYLVGSIDWSVKKTRNDILHAEIMLARRRICAMKPVLFPATKPPQK